MGHVLMGRFFITRSTSYARYFLVRIWNQEGKTMHVWALITKPTSHCSVNANCATHTSTHTNTSTHQKRTEMRGGFISPSRCRVSVSIAYPPPVNSQDSLQAAKLIDCVWITVPVPLPNVTSLKITSAEKNCSQPGKTCSAWKKHVALNPANNSHARCCSAAYWKSLINQKRANGRLC